MAKVVDIDEHRPHLMIIGPINEPHVVPVVMLQRMAIGALPLRQAGNEELDDDMMRGIIKEWLETKGIDIK